MPKEQERQEGVLVLLLWNSQRHRGTSSDIDSVNRTANLASLTGEMTIIGYKELGVERQMLCNKYLEKRKTVYFLLGLLLFFL